MGVDEFPGNSHKERGKEPTESKKIERVVQGEVIRKKKGPWKRFTEMFILGDARSVGSYVVLDILIPALKDAIADGVGSGAEKLLFREVRSSGRRAGSVNRYGSNDNFVNYQNRFGSGSNGSRRDRNDRIPSRRSRATHNFDEIILATRVEAEEVIDRLFQLINRYEQVSVADLYELVGVSADYTDDKWGWTDIRGADLVSRVHNGYLLNLPKPEPLDYN